MEENIINLSWMYPDILNLHGDRGNIQAFEKIAKKLGLQMQIQKVETLHDDIDFEHADILFFPPGELKTIEQVIKALQGNITRLEDYISKNKRIIVIGTSGAIFGKETLRLDGSTIQGLNFLDMDSKEREMVIGDDLYFEIAEEEIIGSQIQMLDITLNDLKALGTVQYGYGNHGDKQEGACNRNLVFTNALGPVFVKNPWWTEKILVEIAREKGYKTKTIPVEDYELEIQSFNAMKRFINAKIQK